MKLYLVERIDENHEQCWGENLSMVVNVVNRGEAEAMAFKTLVLNESNQINKTAAGRDVTHKDLKFTELGIALADLPPGIIIVRNAGV